MLFFAQWPWPMALFQGSRWFWRFWVLNWLEGRASAPSKSMSWWRWRCSPRFQFCKAWIVLLSFKAWFLKEVSQKRCVFELQSLIFEGSLAKTLCFWASKLDFWRKSRKNAVLLSFKAWFLKEVSQKRCVFELQSLIFEGILAKTLCFWASKLDFWRKSRKNAVFLSFKAWFLKEVSQKRCVFELQSFIFEGSFRGRALMSQF